jgi:hypothetical protein
MKQSRVAALALVTTLIAACGGGGGDAPSPAPPAPPSSGALNAQEQLAYQSWAIRVLTTEWVIDDDNAFRAGINFPASQRLRFSGLYPVAPGSGSQNINNFPIAGGIVFSCKDGGTKTKSEILLNNDANYGAGESFTNTFVACKDGAFTGDGTQRQDFRATDVFYPSPNSNAIKSSSYILSVNQTYNLLFQQAVRPGSVKGALDVNITELNRVYKLINCAYTYELGNMVGNTTINIKRTDNFGFDQPFEVLSITGTVQIDGVPFTLTSTPIPWRNASSTGVDYFPKLGSITATGPNGEKIFTQFGTNGASCTLTPQGAAVPSVTVEKCSRI